MTLVRFSDIINMVIAAGVEGVLTTSNNSMVSSALLSIFSSRDPDSFAPGSSREKAIHDWLVSAFRTVNEYAEHGQLAVFSVLPSMRSWIDVQKNAFLEMILGRPQSMRGTTEHPDGLHFHVLQRFNRMLRENPTVRVSRPTWKAYHATVRGQNWRILELSQANKGSSLPMQQYCDQATVVGEFVKLVAEFVGNQDNGSEFFDKTVVRFHHSIALIHHTIEGAAECFVRNQNKFHDWNPDFDLTQYKMTGPILVDGQPFLHTFSKISEREGQSANEPNVVPNAI